MKNAMVVPESIVTSFKDSDFISKRERFISLAFQALITSGATKLSSRRQIAESSVELADALLEVLEKE